MKSLAVWSPDEARRRIWAGDAPAGMRVTGNLELSNSPLLQCLPIGLIAERIDVSGCRNLKKLPEHLQCRELILSRSAVESLPARIHVSARIDASDCLQLRHILPLVVEELILRRCTALKRLPSRLGVRRLDVSGCTSLAYLPAGMASLERLNASGCVRLTTLPEQLFLGDLDISGCTALTKVPEDLQAGSIELAGAGLREVPPPLQFARLFWHGVPVTYREVFGRESINVYQIIAERNQERRRALLDLIGLERFVREARAETLDRDQDAGGQRQLLRVRFNSGEDLVCVVVHCPSTGHRYLLRVPPLMRSCREAIAWTAGYTDPAEYQPMVET